MSRIARILKTLMACRSGTSALEYALIAALISLGIGGVSAELGISTSNLFANTDEEIQAAVRVADVAPAAGPSASGNGNNNNRNNENKNNQGQGQGAGANQ